MTAPTTLPHAHLMVYGFGPDADFEGRLVGALERIESGGSLRILDVLFVKSDAETGELVALDVRGGGAGGIAAPLLGFRLDPSERRRATERALRVDATAVPGGMLRELVEALEPGAALAAVLVEHVWTRALEDAASRTGGTLLASEFIDVTVLAELAPNLLAAARR